MKNELFTVFKPVSALHYFEWLGMTISVNHSTFLPLWDKDRKVGGKLRKVEMGDLGQWLSSGMANPLATTTGGTMNPINFSITHGYAVMKPELCVILTVPPVTLMDRICMWVRIAFPIACIGGVVTVMAVYDPVSFFSTFVPVFIFSFFMPFLMP